MNTILESLKERMEKSVDSLKSAFNKIRTGRANPAILDDIKIDYYGNLTPLNQTSNISVEENRTLVISPWDKTLMPEIEKAITSSDLGLNPSSSGDLIRVTMPTLTEEMTPHPTHHHPTPWAPGAQTTPNSGPRAQF